MNYLLRWTGELRSPATATPLQFLLAPLCDTSKNCKEAIFALGNGISRRKNQHPFPTREAILPISQIVKIGRPWPT